MPHNFIPRFLNLGCGPIFSHTPEWLNMDPDPAVGERDHVCAYPPVLGVPFADNRFDAVYHAHLLEKLARGQVLPFLRECFRVLRPGGILRIVTKDVESLLKSYIDALTEVRAGEPDAWERLRWMQAELCAPWSKTGRRDQMEAVWRGASDSAAAFIRSRVGTALDAVTRESAPRSSSMPEIPLGYAAEEAPPSADRIRWLYDVCTLSALLEEGGFENTHSVSFTESALPDFTLDTAPNGMPRHPHSLYLEARKPFGTPIAEPRVTLFSTSDAGGAAIAALRLHQALRGENVPSLTYVQHKSGNTPLVYVLPPPPDDRVLPDGKGGALLASAPRDRRRQARILGDYPQRPAGSESFSDSEAALRLHNAPLLAESDIFHLHWVAGFIDVPGNTEFLVGKKIVWTLHDMNPFTGGCHYADGCDKYLTQCGACPQLGSHRERDLAWQTWKRREYAYRKLDITVVSPSRWLAEEARKSSLLGRFPVHHIPNGLPLDVFRPYDRSAARNALGLAADARVLMFSAAGVFNRRKGFSSLLEALGLLREEALARNLVLLITGDGGDLLRGLPYSIKAMGRVDRPEIMALAYSAADAVALPTQEDNLPNVLLEALACGTPAVSFAVGGVPEIIEHGKTGWLAPPRDVRALADCLLQALADRTPSRRLACRTTALEHYSLSLQARRYQELYRILISHR